MASILILAILTIGAVSAADENVTDTTADVLGVDSDVESVEELEIEEQEDIAELTASADNTESEKIKQGIKLNANDIYAGETAKISASLAKDATGFVNFKVGNETYHVKIENGIASLNIKNLKFGDYKVISKYAGNYKYDAEVVSTTLAVNRISSKLAFATDFTESGDNAQIKVTMSKKSTGFVKIIINGETYRVKIDSGIAIAKVPHLYDGTYNIKAVYAGNSYTTPGTITGTFQVGKTKSGLKLTTKDITPGETERLTATLAKDATGFVRFIIGGNTYRVAINNGAAYVDIKNLQAGKYSVALKYAGNYKYDADTVSETFSVVKLSPKISATVTDIKVGNKETIKVNLAKDAPGNVVITVNGKSYRVAINNGAASLSVDNLKAGTYKVIVKYGGNYKYNTETKTVSFKVTDPSGSSTANPFNNKAKKVWINADGGSDAFKKSLIAALKKDGWTVYDQGTGSQLHYTGYDKVTSEYSVYITVYNGFCAGTIREAYSSTIQNKLAKKGVQLVVVFDTTDWTNPQGMKPYRYGDFTGYNAKRAWDDNFSGTDPSINNVGQWLKDKGAVYCAYPGVDGVMKQFRAGGYFKYVNS